MKMLSLIKRQMQVVRTPSKDKNLGGLELHFVGCALRKMTFKGWWKTRMDFYVINFADRDIGMRIQGNEFIRPARSAMLISPGIVFEEYYNKPIEVEASFLLIKSSNNGSPFKSLLKKEGYCVFADDAGRVRSLIHETVSVASHDKSQRLLAEISFLKILAHLLQAVSLEGREERIIGPLHHAKNISGNDLRSRILCHLQREPRANMETLAKRLGMSRSTLGYRFPLEMGETLVQFKNRLRIENAQELIGNTRKQIKEISFEAGFDDPAYFNRLFHKLTGFTPTEYRKFFQPDSG